MLWAHKDGLDFPNVHALAGGPLQVFQSLAWAEVVHAALGFVRADPFKTFVQVRDAHTQRERERERERAHNERDEKGSSSNSRKKLFFFLQVLSRVMVVWTVVKPFPSASTSPVVTIMLIAWGITEIVRYSFFVCKQLNVEPAIIKWLR